MAWTNAVVCRWLDSRLPETEKPACVEAVGRGEALADTRTPYLRWDIVDNDIERTGGATAWETCTVEVVLVRGARGDEKVRACRDEVLAWMEAQLSDVVAVFEGLTIRCRPGAMINYQENTGEKRLRHEGRYFELWVSDESEDIEVWGES